MFKTVIKIALFSSVIAVMVTGACSKNNPLEAFEPEIVNNVDAFEFQATDLENVSFTHNYSWQNTGAAATINHSSAVAEGSATIIIYDANNTEVYSSALLASANEETATGNPGTWTVRVVLNNAAGTLNFRIEKL